MSKMRVYELAKILNMNNKELIGKLNEMGVEVKSHSSGVDEETVAKVKKLYGKDDTPKPEQKQEPARSVKPQPKDEVQNKSVSAPVHKKTSQQPAAEKQQASI